MPFFFPSSGFRLPDVSGHPRRRRASGGPGPALGRTRRAGGLHLLPPDRAPRGLGAAGEPRRGRSLGGARPGPRWRAPEQRPRRAELTAVGRARTFPAASAAPLPQPRAVRAGSLHPSAGPRGRGRREPRGGSARGRPGLPANLPPPGSPQPRLPRASAAPWTGKEKVGERRGGAAARAGVKGGGLLTGGVTPTQDLLSALN